MTIASHIYVRVDIAKEKFGVSLLGEKRVRQVANTKKGITEFTNALT